MQRFNSRLRRSRPALRLSRATSSSGGAADTIPSTSRKSCGPPAANFKRIKSSGWTTGSSVDAIRIGIARCKAFRCHCLCTHNTSIQKCRHSGGPKRTSSGTGPSAAPRRHSTRHFFASQNRASRVSTETARSGLGAASARTSMSCVARTVPQVDTASPPMTAYRNRMGRAEEVARNKGTSAETTGAKRFIMPVSGGPLRATPGRNPRVQGTAPAVRPGSEAEARRLSRARGVAAAPV